MNDENKPYIPEPIEEDLINRSNNKHLVNTINEGPIVTGELGKKETLAAYVLFLKKIPWGLGNLIRSC